MKNNKIYFFIGALIVIVIGFGIYYFFINENSINDSKNGNTNSGYILSSAGSSDVNCLSNNDCLNICKKDGCLISSCVKNQDQTSGKCACFNLCGI